MISVIAIITPPVPPEKLSRWRCADQQIVAGGIVFRVPNKRGARAVTAQRHGRGRCDMPHTGVWSQTVMRTKNSLSAGSGCRSQSGYGRGLSTPGAPARARNRGEMRKWQPVPLVDKPVETVYSRV